MEDWPKPERRKGARLSPRSLIALERALCSDVVKSMLEFMGSGSWALKDSLKVAHNSKSLFLSNLATFLV